MVPVHRGGIEAEELAVVGVHAVPQGEQAVDPVAGLGLGVGAVELDVAERPVGQEVPLLEGGHPFRLPPADRQGPGDPLGERPWPRLARVSWRCTRPRPGNDQAGTTMGWPSAS